MANPIKAGDTFLVDTGEKKHLFVSVFDERLIKGHAQKPHVLLVSFSTIHEEIPHDASCEVEPHAHSFINKRSYIVYDRRSRVLASEELLAKCKSMGSGYSIFSPPVSQPLLKRIQQGLTTSKRVPRFVQDEWL